MDQAWINRVTCSIGGYNDTVTYLVNKICTQQRILALQQQNHTTMSDLGLSKGVILHGKPGTGKTVLAQTLAKESKLPYYTVNGPDIFQTGRSIGKKLRSIFDKAKKKAQENKTMVLLIVDELDMLAGKLSKNKTGLDTRTTSILQACLDQLDGTVFILGLTNRLHAIDASFLRSGRLDDIHELVVKLPSQRYSILSILAGKLPFSSDQERTDLLWFVAQHTHSFVPSDLSSLCGQLVLQLVKEEIAGQAQNKKPTLQQHHIDKVLSTIRPANMNAFSSRLPSTRFTDLYGIDDVIEDVKTSVIYPFQHPDHYLQLGIAPPRGIMFYGPPGTGKTMLCSALASEAGVNFIFVESTQLRSKVIGESEKNIASMFAHARSNSPCILFIDQIDMLLPKRGTGSSSENTSDRIVTGFLTEMDGLLTKSNSTTSSLMQMDVLVVAATNQLHIVDSAVLRPGRFDEHIRLSLPDKTQRLAILRGLSKKMPMDLTEEELQILACTHTHGWSGAELDNLLREAAMVCLRQDITNEKINWFHIDQVLSQKGPLV
ncbi:P-loop containing nucleoside triphosphate hydrolase protein [Absidia repens]|uniref:p-loop containing nucleoside triphosphate hydrolase protein n=1 Tax=Absidia repens TaxID=90262 RepID=A0A1X2J2V4_9FUNG|nr:P-loop containing nucleoside triphosphate hydrolase protein [Absidia repens]